MKVYLLPFIILTACVPCIGHYALPSCNPSVRLCAQAVLTVSAHHLYFSLCKHKLSLQPHQQHDYIVLSCDLHEHTTSLVCFMHTPLLTRFKQSSVFTPLQTSQTDTAKLKMLNNSKLIVCVFLACMILLNAQHFMHLSNSTRCLCLSRVKLHLTIAQML